MASTIVTKNSSTASAVPVSGDLTQGELAVNVTDKKLYTKNASGTVVELGTTPTSLTTGAISGTTLAASGAVTFSGGTANGVMYLNGSKVVTTGSALTFDGTELKIQSPSATAATLALRDSGTTNSLIIGSAGQDMYFQTAGAERMRLTSTGLGIGTSSPAYKLDAQTTATGTAAGDNTVGYFGSLASGRDANIRFGDSVNASARIGYLAGALYMYTNGAERMRLDSSGNLGIGTTSPTTKLSITDSTGPIVRLVRTSNRFELSADNDFMSLNARDASTYITFKTADTERARIDSSGNLLVGSTTNTTSAKLILNGATRWAVGPQSGGNIFYITRDSDNVGVYIVQGATSWTATSDERVKDIIEPITDAANKVSSLRAVIGKYKTDADGVRRSFLIAQDVQNVLPEAVNVQDDEQGTMGLQYTDTIPLLVAAIQEQQTLITQLTARITALEGK
jgi:hypothetical protein